MKTLLTLLLALIVSAGNTSAQETVKDIAHNQVIKALKYPKTVAEAQGFDKNVDTISFWVTLKQNGRAELPDNYLLYEFEKPSIVSDDFFWAAKAIHIPKSMLTQKRTKILLTFVLAFRPATEEDLTVGQLKVLQGSISGGGEWINMDIGRSAASTTAVNKDGQPAHKKPTSQEDVMTKFRSEPANKFGPNYKSPNGNIVFYVVNTIQ